MSARPSQNARVGAAPVDYAAEAALVSAIEDAATGAARPICVHEDAAATAYTTAARGHHSSATELQPRGSNMQDVITSTYIYTIKAMATIKKHLSQMPGAGPI
jgi:hypothetical protein